MALVPKLTFCLSNSCAQLSVSETTGSYNVSTNPGGYGTPNPLVSDITAYTLAITDPKNIVYNIDLFTHGFPTLTTTYSYTIPLDILNNRTIIEDGYWQFTWIAKVGNTKYTNNSAYYFTCNTECCVSALLADIDTDEITCNCTDNTEKIMDYLKAKAFLESLKNAAFCGKITLFNNIKSTIDKICAKKSCMTCN